MPPSLQLSVASQMKTAQPLSLFIRSTGSHSHHTLWNSNTRRGVDFSKDVRLIPVHNSKRYGGAFHCLFLYIYMYIGTFLQLNQNSRKSKEKNQQPAYKLVPLPDAPHHKSQVTEKQNRTTLTVLTLAILYQKYVGFPHMLHGGQFL